MDIHLNDILVMKKPHPCGSREWTVKRIGADFRLVCSGCGHQVMLPRSRAEHGIKNVIRDGKTITDLSTLSTKTL